MKKTRVTNLQGHLLGLWTPFIASLCPFFCSRFFFRSLASLDMYDGFSKFMEFSNMTHLIWWSFFVTIVQPWMAGEELHFPWASMNSKTRPFGADSTQPTQVFGICYGLQELFWGISVKDKGKGHDINETRVCNLDLLPPTKLWNLWGGSQAFVGGVPRLKINTFWQVVFVAACGWSKNRWADDEMGKFVAALELILQSLDTEVKENWENERGKRWFPPRPRKNILNNWYYFYVTIKSWCFGSVSPSSKESEAEEGTYVQPSWLMLDHREANLPRN